MCCRPRKKIYPSTSLDENCIEFEFQTDRNYYVDSRQRYLAVKLKVIRGRGYEAYNSNEVKKEYKEEAKEDEEEKAEVAPVLLVTHVNSILNSIFSSVEVTSTISKFSILLDCMRTNPTFATSSREPSLKTREFSTARGSTMKNFLMELWEQLRMNIFSPRQWKCLADLMASCCMVNWGLTFSPLLNCYSQIWYLGFD